MIHSTIAAFSKMCLQGAFTGSLIGFLVKGHKYSAGNCRGGLGKELELLEELAIFLLLILFILHKTIILSS
jgi:hypothetical protein